MFGKCLYMMGNLYFTEGKMLEHYNILFGTMEALGKKWAVPVLLLLFFYGECSFTALKKALKVTSRSLSRKLHILENLGLVERKVQRKENGTHYRLSQIGKSVSQSLVRISQHF